MSHLYALLLLVSISVSQSFATYLKCLDNFLISEHINERQMVIIRSEKNFRRTIFENEFFREINEAQLYSLQITDANEIVKRKLTQKVFVLFSSNTVWNETEYDDLRRAMIRRSGSVLVVFYEKHSEQILGNMFEQIFQKFFNYFQLKIVIFSKEFNRTDESFDVYINSLQDCSSNHYQPKKIGVCDGKRSFNYDLQEECPINVVAIHNPPFIFYNESRGIEYNLVAMIAQRLNIRVKFTFTKSLSKLSTFIHSSIPLGAFDIKFIT